MSKNIKLNNLELINELTELDSYTNNLINNIKNPIFKNNVIDLEVKKIVSSIYLKKKSKLGKNIETMIWQYYRHRGKQDVNEIIYKYQRDNLIINYSTDSNINKKIEF